MVIPVLSKNESFLWRNSCILQFGIVRFHDDLVIVILFVLFILGGKLHGPKYSR